jgi:hypothetical protein
MSIQWWNNLGLNPLLRIIEQGRLTTKYFGSSRIPKSLKDNEIEKIFISEQNYIE